MQFDVTWMLQRGEYGILWNRTETLLCCFNLRQGGRRHDHHVAAVDVCDSGRILSDAATSPTSTTSPITTRGTGCYENHWFLVLP